VRLLFAALGARRRRTRAAGAKFAVAARAQ
jgi:hypothetical protein